MPLKETKLFLIPKRDNTKPGNQFLETMSLESTIYTLEQDDEHQMLPLPGKMQTIPDCCSFISEFSH